MNEAHDNWLKFLNPEELYKNFLLSSLFITTHNLLKSSIVGRIRSFYNCRFDSTGWHTGIDYEQKVLSLDDKKDVLRSSINWLFDMQIIDELDKETIEKARRHRNDLAHEMLKYLSDVKHEIDIELLQSMRDLIDKIERWFIFEVEIPTEPDMTAEEFNSINWDEVRSMTMLTLDYVQLAIFGDIETTSRMYEQLKDTLTKRNTNAESTD